MKKNNHPLAAFCSVLSIIFGLYIAGKLFNAHFMELSAIAFVLFCFVIPLTITKIVDSE